ncbi:hypothetical protein GGI07_000670 [Coemansia sp. Benny D115]|nr:hypothetical protein GGI07_000670 [Coemansia sp. Benny D115]
MDQGRLLVSINHHAPNLHQLHQPAPLPAMNHATNPHSPAQSPSSAESPSSAATPSSIAVDLTLNSSGQQQYHHHHHQQQQQTYAQYPPHMHVEATHMPYMPIYAGQPDGTQGTASAPYFYGQINAQPAHQQNALSASASAYSQNSAYVPQNSDSINTPPYAPEYQGRQNIRQQKQSSEDDALPDANNTVAVAADQTASQPLTDPAEPSSKISNGAVADSKNSVPSATTTSTAPGKTLQSASDHGSKPSAGKERTSLASSGGNQPKENRGRHINDRGRQTKNTTDSSLTTVAENGQTQSIKNDKTKRLARTDRGRKPSSKPGEQTPGQSNEEPLGDTSQPRSDKPLRKPRGRSGGKKTN